MKVIPFSNGKDGKKYFPAEYAEKYRGGQTVEQLQQLFMRPCDGIALLCTDGIEAVDIDVKHDTKGTILSDFMDALDEFGFNASGVVQKTKSGGVHIIYRVAEPSGNQKLAKREGAKEAMVETRGDGGILFVYPTPGYEVTAGDIYNLPEISQEDRNLLLSIGRHFDEQKPEAAPTPAVERTMVQTSGLRPLDAFNAATSVLDLATSAGWTPLSHRGDYIRLNRPGAKHSKGVDATVNVSKNRFYAFTSSSEFDPSKSYSPAAFYAITEHKSDFAAAAKELYAKGFGDRTERASAAAADSTGEIAPAPKPTTADLIAVASATRYKYGQKLVEPAPMLIMQHDRDYKIGGRGMIGVLTGHEKSGKSFTMSCIAASALKGSEIINFKLNLEGGKMLWFDMEQSGFFFHKTQERIHKLAGLDRGTQIYDAYHLRQMSPDQRLQIVEHFVYNTPDLSCVVIDGFVDLVTDYNDLKLVQDFVNRLMRWSDEKNILIMGVVHVNKGDGKIRGHIGSELKNKCDFVINTAKSDGGFFTITNPTSRYGQFPDTDFSRTEGSEEPQYRSYYKETFGEHSRPFPHQSTDLSPAPFTVPTARGLKDQDIPF